MAIETIATLGLYPFALFRAKEECDCHNETLYLCRFAFNRSVLLSQIAMNMRARSSEKNPCLRFALRKGLSMVTVSICGLGTRAILICVEGFPCLPGAQQQPGGKQCPRGDDRPEWDLGEGFVRRE